MQMLYNSDTYAVVQFDALPSQESPRLSDDVRLQAPPAVGSSGHALARVSRGGYEIVDKYARREVFIEGALAERFEVGVRDLIESSPNEDEIDDFLEGFAAMAQQPVLLH